MVFGRVRQIFRFCFSRSQLLYLRDPSLSLQPHGCRALGVRISFSLVPCTASNFQPFFELIHLSTHNSLTSIGGTIGLQISFLVAFSQLVPAHTVTLFKGILSLRVPRFPLLYIGIVTFLTITPLFSAASLFLAIFGFVTSWAYLRFYKTVFPDLDTTQPTSLRGDASESFAFAEFFPGPAKPFVSAVTDQIFNILVTLRICTPFTPAEISAARGDSFQLPTRSHSGSSNRAEAERRRALALKALDQRLHAATASTKPQAPPPPPPTTTGPAVQTQPRPNTQTAMTSQPESATGETSFVPDPEHTYKADP